MTRCQHGPTDEPENCTLGDGEAYPAEYEGEFSGEWTADDEFATTENSVAAQPIKFTVGDGEVCFGTTTFVRRATITDKADCITETETETLNPTGQVDDKGVRRSFSLAVPRRWFGFAYHGNPGLLRVVLGARQASSDTADPRTTMETPSGSSSETTVSTCERRRKPRASSQEWQRSRRTSRLPLSSCCSTAHSTPACRTASFFQSSPMGALPIRLRLVGTAAPFGPGHSPLARPSSSSAGFGGPSDQRPLPR
jgi:hypothetical protein